MVVRPGGEGREDDQDNRRKYQRVRARPLVRPAPALATISVPAIRLTAQGQAKGPLSLSHVQVPKGQLPHHSPSKRNIPQIMLSIRRLPHIAVLQSQDGNNRPDDLRHHQIYQPDDTQQINPVGRDVYHPAQSLDKPTLLMYPSENNPAPQAITGRMAVQNDFFPCSSDCSASWASASLASWASLLVSSRPLRPNMVSAVDWRGKRGRGCATSKIDICETEKR